VARKRQTTNLAPGYHFLSQTTGAMADIYTKGTRVWFPDKEQGWISAEVQSSTKGTKDGIKITFTDERGKVGVFLLRMVRPIVLTSAISSGNNRRYWYRRG
jgi:hypothetical protein